MSRNLNLLSFFLYGLIICASDIPYIIYTTESFQVPAENIAELHNETIPLISNFESLETEIIYKETMNENSLIDYLNTFNSNCSLLTDEYDCTSNQNCIWDMNNSCIGDSKYLLIIGDESIINPPSTGNICGFGNNQFSDDIFNEEFTIGRLIVNNLEEAINQTQKIIDYITNPTSGIWKNELLLIADDQNNPSNPNSLTEINHTINTSNIYSKLENKLMIRTLYGEEFSEQAIMTNSIINTINSGVGIINYIGHGTHQSLAHELILKMDRDIDLINTNNKPPIWVVGTCSFGQYIDNICMAEELMNKEDAAIAIISTTDGIPATSNNTYLNDFYDRMGNYINGDEYRLGDIFKKAKLQFQNQCTPYKFQLFGDPALPLLISRETYDLANIPNEIVIGDANIVSINDQYDNSSYIRVIGPNISTSIQNTNYLKPGPVLFESSNFTEEISFYTPIDAIYNNAKLFIINEDNSNIDNNIIQVEPTIPMNQNIDDNILMDNEGPEILLYFNNIQLQNNATIYKPYNLKIYFSDNLPINLSGFNFHYLKLWLDGSYSNGIILNDYPFISTSNTSGYFEVNLNESIITNTQHTINVEGWDILNNYNTTSIDINIVNNKNDRIFNVFNLPNPFQDKTFFTFQMIDPEPIHVKIKVISKTGKKIISFEESINEILDYHVIPKDGWNGTNSYNEKLSNGTYFYHLGIKDNQGRILHNAIHNITIIN